MFRTVKSLNWQLWLLALAACSVAAVDRAQDTLSPDPAALAGRALKSKGIMESKNVEIRFYGKVVDQDEKPLAGVTVKASARTWEMKNPFEPVGKNRYDSKVTGPDGLFTFTSFYGDALDLDSIAKTGYILTKRTPKSYLYGPLDDHYIPNSLVPVVFHMWRTNGSVPLYEVRFQMSIPQDGTILSFDLRRNKRVTLPTEDTDLRITLNQHAPPGQRNARTPFDWSFVLEVPDGGVIETQDEFLYLAPEQGYQPKWSVDYPKDVAPWKARRVVSFYLHNRAGQQYGQLTMDFRPEAGDRTGYLAVQGYLNPNGRVLEFDSFKKLYPPPMGVPGGGSASVPARLPVQFNVPGVPGPAQPGVPVIPPPPPGFEALTNRAKGFTPTAPARPPQ